MVDFEKLRVRLEELGETEVRRKRSHFGLEKHAFIDTWLQEAEDARQAAATGRQESREEESLRLARAANTIAVQANRIAKESNTKSARANLIAWLALLVAVGVAFLQWWLDR
jgi:hypothetical protein